MDPVPTPLKRGGFSGPPYFGGADKSTVIWLCYLIRTNLQQRKVDKMTLKNIIPLKDQI